MGYALRASVFFESGLLENAGDLSPTVIFEDGTNQGVINANEVRRGDPSAL